MTAELSPDAIRRALIAKGVPLKKAATWMGVSVLMISRAERASPAPPEVRWPVRLVIPWSCLISDNDRATPVGNRLILTARYKDARKRIREIAGAAMGGAFPVRRALSFHAALWVPNNRPHDCGNMHKGIADALEHVVYVNDRWLYRTTWERAGVDVDAPRALLTLSPYRATP